MTSERSQTINQDNNSIYNVSQDQLLPRIKQLIEKPTKLKFLQASTQQSQQSQFAQIIKSFHQQEDHLTYDKRQSSKKISSNEISNYKIQIIFDVIDNNQELDKLLDNPSKYVVYQTSNYYIAIIGPLIINLGLTDRIGVYIANQKQCKQYQDKKLVKIQRKQIKQKPSIFDYNYFVCEPKQILFPTLIFKWLNCARNSFLQSYFGVDISNYYMLLGITGHTVLQKLINQQIQLSINKSQFYSQIYHQNIQKMYILNIKEQVFIKDCLDKFQHIYSFYKTHILSKQQIEIDKYKKQYLKLIRVVGAEYSIKSKIFGMKGKIDLLLECMFIDKKLAIQKKVMVPLELKTGENSNSTHVYQVHVYNILLIEQFGIQSIGLLYYPITNKTLVVISDTKIVHQIMIKRNQYIIHRKKKIKNAKVTLPKLTPNTSLCTKCQIKQQCIAVSLTQIKDIEDFDDIQNYQLEDAKKIISLIDVKSKQYIEKWLQLLHLQERAKQKQYLVGLKEGLDQFKITDTNKLIQQIKEGRQFSQVVLRSRELTEGEMFTVQNMFKIGDKVRMNILMIKSSIYLEVEKIKRFNERLFLVCKAFIGKITFSHQKIPNEKVDVEIQKFGCSDSYSTERSTIINYCLTQSKHSTYKYIVQNQKAQFQQNNKLKWYYTQNIKQSQTYNPQQKQAIRKALFMNDFSLVEGYPGTGKTFLILQLIQIFRKIGMKVLVTSFTNTSLNNILRIIIEDKLINNEQIVRYGNKSLKEGQFKDLSFDPSAFKSIEEIIQYFKSKYLWFVTLTSLYNQIVPSDFDIVIVDEASQCIQPLCVNAIIKAKKFVLVGDYKQLGPIISDKYAQSKGMKISLFQKLCLNYPSFTTPLTKQWRMCQEIMTITNNLVYDNSLSCANQTVQTQKLQINQQKLSFESSQIKQIINPSKPLLFLCLDAVISQIKSLIDSIFVFRSISQLQINLVSSIYALLIKMGVNRKKICVISFFNKTNSHIVKRLKQMDIIDRNDGDILTIDKSQGIDKQCIIFLMQSGSDSNSLAKDISRLNVAMTRAKSKLIIVGNKEQAKQIFNEKVYDILNKNLLEVTEDMVEQLLDK